MEKRTLVTCLSYHAIKPGTPGKPRYSTLADLEPEKTRIFVLDCEPKRALNILLPKFFVQSYLGHSPWIVSAGIDRGYLAIDSTDIQIPHGTIGEFLRFRKGVSCARRAKPLERDRETREKLIKSLLGDLNPEDCHDDAHLLRRGMSSGIYADVLGALGYDISLEAIENIMDQQLRNQDARDIRERAERAIQYSHL